MCRTAVSVWMVTNWVKSSTEYRALAVSCDLPDDHGGDLDRVAVGVVDLGLRRFLVADPGGDRDAAGERVHPLQAGVADGAAVATEQLDDACPPGDDRGETPQREGAGDKDQDAEQAQRPGDTVPLVTGHHDQCHPGEQQHNAQHQHAQAGHVPGLALGHPPARHFRAHRGCVLGGHVRTCGRSIRGGHVRACGRSIRGGHVRACGRFILGCHLAPPPLDGLDNTCLAY